MVVGCFISALHEGQSKIQKSQAKTQRMLQDFKKQDVVEDSQERFISLQEFRDLQKTHPAFAQLLGNKGDSSSAAMTDEPRRTSTATGARILLAIFRQIDTMDLGFLTLPDFVLGILKLLRVVPKPEFSAIDEQQQRALKNFHKVAGGNRFNFLVTNRYLQEFRMEMSKFVEKSHEILRAEARPSRHEEFRSVLAAVSEEEAMAINKSFIARMQARYGFRKRLQHVETTLQELTQRQEETGMQDSFRKVADIIMEEEMCRLPSSPTLPAFRQQREEQQHRRSAALRAPKRDEVPHNAARPKAPVEHPLRPGLSQTAVPLASAPPTRETPSPPKFRLSSQLAGPEWRT
eukprot:g14771.t1